MKEIVSNSLLVVVLAVFGFVGSVSKAATGFKEEEISSAHLTGAPYMSVSADPKGSSEYSPGIYARTSAKSVWELILDGDILSTMTGPLLAEFELTKVSKRYESLVILDGVLTLFSINSTKADPNSYIQVGKGDHLLLDIQSNRKLALPQINSLKDVEVYEVPLGTSKPYQMILASIKDHLGGDSGSGYTFGLLVKVANSEDKALELMQSPVLLDYQFHKSQDLRRLVVIDPEEGVQGAVSRLFLSVLSRPNSEDAKPLAEWKTDLQGFRGSEAMEGLLPYYNLESLEFVMPIPPSAKLFEFDRYYIEQIYGLGDDDYVNINSPEQRFKLFGRVDTNNEGMPLIYQQDYQAARDDQGGGNRFVVFFHNGELYLSSMLAEGTEPLKIQDAADPTLKQRFPDEFSFHVVRLPNSSSIIVVTSEMFDHQAVTKVFKVSNTPLGKGLVDYSYDIIDEYYTRDELELRMLGDDENSRVLFDYKTPHQKSKAAYEQSYRGKALHFDLAKESHHKTYIQPAKEESLASGVYYREFEEDEEEGAHRSQTGIYVVGKKNEVTHFDSGDLIYDKENKRPYWDKLNVKYPSLGEAEITAVVTDLGRNGGAEDFTLRVYVAPRPGQSTPVTAAADDTFDFPVSRLKIVKLITGKKDSARFTVITVSQDSSGEEEEVSAMTFAMQPQGKGRKPVIQPLMEQSLDVSLSFSERDITDRIVYDDRGEAYWVMTPDLDSEEVRYEIRSFADQESIEPNGDSADPARTYQTYYEAQENSAANVGRKVTDAFEWMVRKQHLKASPLIEFAKEKGINSVRTDLFPKLIKVLNDLADSEKSPKHKVVVVPDDLKPHIRQLILSYWLNPRGEGKSWNKFNKDMELFAFSQSSTDNQSQYMRQLQVLAETRGGQRAVMYADAADVIKLSRPRASQKTGKSFLIPEDHADDSGNLFDDFDSRMVSPHALYLLATEGRRVEVNKFKESPASTARYSQLVLASESDWDALMGTHAKLEASYGLEEHFDVMTLTAPEFDEQKRLFKEVFEDYEIRKKNYSYEAGSRSSAEMAQPEHLDRLVGYLVTRIENLSKEQHKNSLMAFSDVLVKLRHTLLFDEDLRRSGMIDRSVLEQTLAKVFVLPLKLRHLPEDDPLRILSSPDILVRLQNVGGYPGPFDLTRQVVDTILGQTRQETAKAIPASIILDGETGTGKTQLFRSLVKTLDLRMYDINKGPMHMDNLNSQAFILPVSKLTESSSAPGLLNVDDALSHLEHFLSLPNGYRGFILFDDLHNCTDAVRSKILARIRTMFDSEDGMISVKSEFYDGSDGEEGSEYVSFPGRNLSLFLTYNPTDDLDKIKKYMGDNHGEKVIDPKARALAALAGEGVQVDKAFFERFTLFLNMDEFPLEAKGPSLIERMMNQVKDFYQDGQLVAFPPEVIQAIVQRFSSTDARNFLSGAVNGLSQKVADSFAPDEAGFRIVVPYRLNESRDKGSEEGATTMLASASSEAPIKSFIRDHTRVLGVSQENPEGRLSFIKLLTDSFRKQVFESYVQATRSHSGFAGSDVMMSIMLSVSHQAVLDHFGTRPMIPLGAMNLDPAVFGMDRNLEAENFIDLISGLSISHGATVEEEKAASDFFPKIFGFRGSQSGVLNNLVKNDSFNVPEENRGNINSEYVDKVKLLLKIYLSEKLHVDGLSGFPNGAEWIHRIQEDLAGADSGDETAATTMGKLGLGRELADLFFVYMKDMEANALVEKRDANQFEDMTFYDKLRMFMVIVDRAIVELPWIKVTDFLISGLEEASDSVELGGLSGVQEYLFGKQSLLRPSTGDQMGQILLSSSYRLALGADVIKETRSRYESKCGEMLSIGGPTKFSEEGGLE